jgi:hypothetical protein
VLQSRKLQGHEFFAKRRNGKQSPIRIDAIALSKSPVSLTTSNEAPHIFTRKPRLRPLEFLIIRAKRLLQHNHPRKRTSLCTILMSANISGSEGTHSITIPATPVR